MKTHVITKKICQWLMMITLSQAIIGCGFQLRGHVDVPAHFQTISLKANPNKEFTKTLIEQLKANNIQVTSTASTRLSITENKNERRTVSYSGRGKSAEYEIIKRIGFKATDSKDKSTLLPETILQARRTLIIDDTKASAMKEQEELILKEMEFDLATKLLVQLQKAK